MTETLQMEDDAPNLVVPPWVEWAGMLEDRTRCAVSRVIASREERGRRS